MPNDKTPNQPAVASVPTDAAGSDVTVVEKQPNAIVRGFRKIKNTPPKTAIAVGLGVVLVGAGTVLGRKTAPLHVEIVESDVEIEPMLVTADYSETVNDTETA